jgi:hypothetical protein
MFDIKGLFTVEAIQRRLAAYVLLLTPVMDLIYSNRPQLGLPIVGSDMIQSVARAMPVVRRGGASISTKKDSGNTAFYEPLSIRPNVMVTGHDLNNLKVLGVSGKEAWANQKTDYLRRICRATAEAMAAVSLAGTLTWPVQLENGGFETWEIDFGSVLSLTPTTLWDATGAKIRTVFDTLQDMQEKIQEKGYGGTLEIWAGKTAYSTLYGLAEAKVSTANMQVSVSDKGIDVGGFLVKRRAERYRNPQTGTMVPVVGDKVVKMIATDAGHQMPYCALDDLDANLMPLPFFVKPISIPDPSGWKLVAESKPFPIPNVDGICDAIVLG